MKKMLLTAALSVCCLVPANAEDWGTVTGQFIVTGEIPAPELMHDPKAEIKDKAVCGAVNPFKDDLVVDKDSKGLANVFVYLVKAPKSIHPDLKNPDPAKLVLDQKGCVFIPHAMVVRGGQTVEVISSDAIAHNTHTNPIKNQPMNVVIAPNTPVGKGEIVDYKLGERLPTKVNCDFHPWMICYWMVVDHPYAAVTDKDGKFTIANLPAGEHEFRVWHERVGYLDKKLELKYDGLRDGKKAKLDGIRLTVKTGDNAQPVVEVPIDKLKVEALK